MLSVNSIFVVPQPKTEYGARWSNRKQKISVYLYYRVGNIICFPKDVHCGTTQNTLSLCLVHWSA